MFKFLSWQKYVLAFTALMILGAAFGIVGSYDYDESLASEKLYCENVKSGVWPAYDKEIKCK